MSEVLAIIVTYNGEAWIEGCLSSLLNNTLKPDILVIDNCSSDRTVDQVNTLFPEVSIISSKENLGFGQANNIGLRKVLDENYRYALLLNQDAKIDPTTIEDLVSVAQNNPNYGILSPFHFSWDGDKVDHFFLRMVGPDDCSDFLSDSLMNKRKDVYTLKFIHAACWLVTRKCILDVGGFDPLFYHYGEDNDYVTRVQLHGLTVGIAPQTNVYHYGCYDVSKPRPANDHMLTVEILLRLKNLNASLIGNYILFTKHTMDRITSAFLTRQIKASFSFLKYYKIAAVNMKRIRLARKRSMKKTAFL